MGETEIENIIEQHNENSLSLSKEQPVLSEIVKIYLKKLLTVTIPPQRNIYTATDSIIKALTSKKAKIWLSWLPLELQKKFEINKLLIINEFYVTAKLNAKCDNNTFKEIKTTPIICYFKFLYEKVFKSLPIKVNIVTSEQALIINLINQVTNLTSTTLEFTSTATLQANLNGEWIKSSITTITDTQFIPSAFSVNQLIFNGVPLTDEALKLNSTLAVEQQWSTLIEKKFVLTTNKSFNIAVIYYYQRINGQFNLTIDDSTLIVNENDILSYIMTIWDNISKEIEIKITAMVEKTKAIDAILAQMKTKIANVIVSKMLIINYRKQFKLNELHFADTIEWKEQTSETNWYQKNGQYQLTLQIKYGTTTSFQKIPVKVTNSYTIQELINSINTLSDFDVTTVTETPFAEIKQLIKNKIRQQLPILSQVNFNESKFTLTNLVLDNQLLIEQNLEHAHKLSLIVNYQYCEETGKTSCQLTIKDKYKEIESNLKKGLTKTPISIKIGVKQDLNEGNWQVNKIIKAQINTFNQLLPSNLKTLYDTKHICIFITIWKSPGKWWGNDVDGDFYQKPKENQKVYFSFNYIKDQKHLGTHEEFVPLNLTIIPTSDLNSEIAKCLEKAFISMPLKMRIGTNSSSDEGNLQIVSIIKEQVTSFDKLLTSDLKLLYEPKNLNVYIRIYQKPQVGSGGYIPNNFYESSKENQTVYFYFTYRQDQTTESDNGTFVPINLTIINQAELMQELENSLKLALTTKPLEIQVNTNENREDGNEQVTEQIKKQLTSFQPDWPASLKVLYKPNHIDIFNKIYYKPGIGPSNYVRSTYYESPKQNQTVYFYFTYSTIYDTGSSDGKFAPINLTIDVDIDKMKNIKKHLILTLKSTQIIVTVDINKNYQNAKNKVLDQIKKRIAECVKSLPLDLKVLYESKYLKIKNEISTRPLRSTQFALDWGYFEKPKSNMKVYFCFTYIKDSQWAHDWEYIPFDLTVK